MFHQIKIGLAILTVLLGLWACSSQTSIQGTDEAAPRPPTGAVVPDRSAPESQGSNRYSVQSAPIEAKQAPQIFPGTGVFIRSHAPTKPTVAATGGDTISLNFVDTEVADVVATILGDILSLNYLIDSSVTGSVTIQTNRPLPRNHLLSTLETILSLVGAAMVESDGLYKIVPLSAARRAGVPVRTHARASAPGRGFNVQIVPLHYVPAREMERILEPLMEKENFLLVDEVRNLLVLSGAENELRGIIEIINIFDVDWMSGMSFGLFPLRFASVTMVAEELAKIFGQDRQKGLSELIRLETIDRLNALLVVTQQPAYLKQVQVWIDRLDRSSDGTERRIYVYYLENARAESLGSALSEIFSGGEETNSRDLRLAPGLQGVDIGPSRGRSPKTTPIGEPAVASIPEPGRQAALPAVPPEEGIVLEESGQIRIIPDLDHNALIILATPQEYRMIEATLRKLDIVPLQVLIQASIFEVTLTDDLSYGIRWFFERGNHTLEINNLPPVAGAFSYAFSSANFAASIEALASITELKIISSPEIMVLDNHTATLEVGDQIPVATRSAVSVTDSNAPIVNDIQFRNTGVILRVTPRINSGGLVTMDIEQEVSNVAPSEEPTVTPTIFQRTIRSTVAVMDGESVALGGLISEDQRSSRSGVPILMDIPILGALFRSTTEDTRRTELLVIITPKIIRNEVDARRVTNELRRRMDHVRRIIREFEERTTDGNISGQVDRSMNAPDDDQVQTENMPKADMAIDGADEAASAPVNGQPLGSRSETSTPIDEVDDSGRRKFAVHLASHRIEARAAEEWRQLSQKFPSLLGKLEPIINRTDLWGLGFFYRLKAGPIESEPLARDLCRQLRTRKQYCQVMSLSTPAS